MLVLRSLQISMLLKRTATIVVAGGALAAWLAAATTPPERHAAPLPARAAAVAASSAELAIETARLHERLRPDAAPRQPGRNLFTFDAPPAETRLAIAPMPVPIEPVLAPAAPMPALKLAGIAEDPGPSGPIRTAVISGPGQLFLVKEGESVTSRYRVEKISADVVELADLDDGTTRRLALK
jgi:hypothetical protein